MTWSTKQKLLEQLEKLWDKGLLLSEYNADTGLFPKRLVFKSPSSKALTDDFDEVRVWVGQIQKLQHFRVVYKTVRHRVMGQNNLPDEVWVDHLDTAIKLLHKQQELKLWLQLITQTEQRVPVLIRWLKQFPLKALVLAPVWAKLIDFIEWRQQQNNPNIYLRQISLPGIDSKFIEQHRKVLASLLDLALPSEQINPSAVGLKQFEQRYGFRSKPERIRFRLLDADFNPWPGGDADINITASDFQAWCRQAEFAGQIQRVFITENEINFLSFPKQKHSLVIFGAGYGFNPIGNLAGLEHCQVFYWGDIDSHGFAILDQLRSKLPQVQSLLMDAATLVAHLEYFGRENSPQSRELTRLTAAEQNLYQALINNDHGEDVRFEQERVPFEYLISTLAVL